MRPIRFLIDAQLPPRLARVIAAEGYLAEHLEDLGIRHAKDSAIWDYAKEKDAVLITKDEDFVNRFRRQQDTPVIVWLRIGNATNRVLIDWIMPALPTIVARLETGDRFVEVR